MENLIQKWSPILYFHPDEKYFPCSINWLLSHSKLVEYTENKSENTKTYSENVFDKLTNMDLYNLSKTHNFKNKFNGDIILSTTNELNSGEIPLKNVPCYALLRRKNSNIYITFIFLYAYNGDYNILNIANVGSHPGDLEHMTVELTENGDLIRVMYGAHRSENGRWVAKDDIEFENGKIVAYVAKNGHGLYHRSGYAIRLFGLANDGMDRGVRWEPRAEQIYLPSDPSFIPETMGWVSFIGRIGGKTTRGNQDGIQGLSGKPWIKDIDELDEKKYNYPPIVSLKTGKIVISILQILALMIIYIIVYKLLITSHNIFDNGKNTISLKTHVFTLACVMIVFYGLYEILKRIIDYFSPK
jgi:hypothetical protein